LSIKSLRSQIATLNKDASAKTGRGQHRNFSQNTGAQLRQVFIALKELMTPPEPPKRPIGFVPLEDKSKNLTREAMADVDENRFIDDEAVLAWSSSLNTDNPLIAPQVSPKT
jgi:hypothetical protein